MTKNEAKTLTCILLGAESFGMVAAFVVSVFTVAEWGQANIRDYGAWVMENGLYLLSVMALVYGFILRPIRRKAVEKFSSVIHFKNWVYYAEGAAAVVFALSGYLHCCWLSLLAIALYSAWKIIEIAGDSLLLNRCR